MEIRRNEIVNLEEKLIEGIRTSNIQFLDKVLHDDLLFLAPDGQVVTKSADLASHKRGEMVVDTVSSTIEEIKIVGDTAIVVVVYDTKGRMLGSPIQGRFRYIRIWKRFDDGLRVVGGGCIKL